MHKQVLKLAAMSLLVAWMALPPVAVADPPPWAPAHGYRAKQYRYVYYPRYQVYFAPETQLWFWLDGGGRWRVGASLPAGIVVGGVPGVSVILGTARPYEEHTYVVQRFGGRRHGHDRHHHRRDYEDD